VFCACLSSSCPSHQAFVALYLVGGGGGGGGDEEEKEEEKEEEEEVEVDMGGFGGDDY
jgi:ribosomal protein L12E/L44/L45/RPP1/RPP2